jgi:hypothetical protein
MSATAAALTLSINLNHKNADETGNGAQVGETLVVGGDDLASQHRFLIDIDSGGFKELVRYKYELVHTSGSNAVKLPCRRETR